MAKIQTYKRNGFSQQDSWTQFWNPRLSLSLHKGKVVDSYCGWNLVKKTGWSVFGDNVDYFQTKKEAMSFIETQFKNDEASWEKYLTEWRSN